LATTAAPTGENSAASTSLQSGCSLMSLTPLTNEHSYVRRCLCTSSVTLCRDSTDDVFVFRAANDFTSDAANEPLALQSTDTVHSISVTLRVKYEAVSHLRQLAEDADLLLSNLGVLSVQIEGERAIELSPVTPESDEIGHFTKPRVSRLSLLSYQRAMMCCVPVFSR